MRTPLSRQLAFNEVLKFLLQLGQQFVHLVPFLLLNKETVATSVHQPDQISQRFLHTYQF